MNKFSVTGYKDNSPDRKNKQNIIQGRNITMKGVSIPLTLVPIVGGKPMYDRKRIANPGDSDIEFEEDVEGVLEMPNTLGGGIPNPYGVQGAVGNVAPLPNIDMYNSTPENPFQRPGVEQRAIDGLLPQMDFKSTDYNVGSYLDPGQGLKSQDEITLDTAKALSLDYGNVRQQANAMQTKESEKEKEKTKPVGAQNPYGGWNMHSASTALGAFIEDKNGLGVVGAIGKIGLEGARNAFAGAAAMKNYNESKNEYETNIEDSGRKSGWQWFQKGGTTGKLLTGNFIKGDDNHQNPNVEIEKGEYAQTPDGSTMEVMGKRHSDGGELMNLPEGSKVISDYLKIGVKLATFFKKEYGLNVRAGSTFATVLDQYKKKIGLTELLEKEAKIMGRIADQEDVEFESTREMNLQVLSEKVNEIKPQKQELDNRFEVFTNLVFEKQEETKGESGDNFEKQEGGDVEQPVMDENGQPMVQQEQPQQGGGGSEIEQIIVAFAEMTGQDPQELIQQLQQLPEEELQGAIEQMVQALQQGGGGQPQQEGGMEPQQQEPMMQMGGATGQGNDMMQQIAQALQQGAQPEEVLQQLVQAGMPEQEATQVLQQLMSQMQGGSQQPTMRSGGRHYLQEGGENRPFDDDQTQQGDFTNGSERRIMKDGVEWRVFGEGNNTRMVPLETLSNSASPYRSGEYKNEEYSSEGQSKIKQESETRYKAEPITLSGVKDKNEAMRIQKVLKDSGYDIGKSGVDGKIGKDTSSAMRKMEEENPEVYKTWINVDTGSLPQPKTSPKVATASTSNTNTGNKGKVQIETVAENKAKTKGRINTLPTDVVTTAQVETKNPNGRNMAWRPEDRATQYSEFNMAQNNNLAIDEYTSNSNETRKQNITKARSEDDYFKRQQSLKEPFFDEQTGLVYSNGQPYSYENFKNNMKMRSNKPYSGKSVKQYSQQKDVLRRAESFYKQNGGEVYDEVQYAQNGLGYVGAKIAQGKSSIGAQEIENEIVNPLSERSVTSFFDTFGKYSEEGKKKAEAWKARYDQAKTDGERIKIMDQAQGDRQTFIESIVPSKVLNISSAGYAPVQSDIQLMYNGLKTKAEKDEYSRILTENGWGIDDKGKVLGGNYKYQAGYKPGNSLYDYTKKYAEANPDVMNTIYTQRRTDGKWDRRMETLHNLEFDTAEIRDKYAKDNGMIIEGDFWVDPNDTNNIIRHSIKGQPVDPATAKAEDAKVQNPDPNANIDALDNLDKNAESGLPMRTPDQSNLPPSYLPVGYREVGHTQANAIRISPEETLKELNRQYNTASNSIIESNPYTAGAAQANLQAQSNNSINQAYSQAAIVNAQDERNVQNTNEQRIMQRDQTNMGRLDQYEKNAIVGLDNYTQSWRNFIDKKNLENVNNYNLENQRQAFNAVNDNYKIGASGWYQTPERPNLMYRDLPGGGLEEYNRETEKTRVVSTTSADGKTKVIDKNKTKKQKGGLLLSKGKRNW